MTPDALLARLQVWTERPTDPAVEVQAACPHDCPDTCAMRIGVQDGRVVEVKGDPTHALTDGVLCTKVSRYAERVYHPDRLLTPMKRIGRKGEGRFAPISWEEATAFVADRLAAVWRRNPEAILPYSYAGTMGQVQGEGMASRLFHALGTSLLERTICSSAGSKALEHCMGAYLGMDPEALEDARLIVLWGTNPITSNLHLWRVIQRAKRKGAVLWAIDPYRSDTAAKCHHHLALRPGSDAALAYAIAHVLQRDGLLDRAYLDAHTQGAAAFLREAQSWTPARAAAWCDVPEADIEALAQAYGRTRSAAIRLSYGVQRTAGGADAVRAILALPALAGHWREPAGGAVLSTSGWLPRDPALTRPDLLGARRPRLINMSQIGAALESADPAIEALVVYNSNPVAVAPDSNAVRRGFAREDLFTVVVEQFQTDTADYADIVLPATTQLEHFDIHRAYGHLYLLLNRPAIAPLGEARPNSRIFRELAQALAGRLDDACPALRHPAATASDAEIARDAFVWSHPSLAGTPTEHLLTHGHARLAAAAPGSAPFAHGGFATPDQRFRFTFPDTPKVRPNHEDWQGAQAQRYPLQVISPPARHLLNSSFANIDSLLKLDNGPALHISPADAARRGIADGDLVRIFNARGEHRAQAQVSARARPGVVVAFSIYWHKHSPGGHNCNAVTSQALTDHGNGATFYDCLVEVEKAADEAA
jgi:anaerobic selenocysteine-containing dehydrogenase